MNYQDLETNNALFKYLLFHLQITLIQISVVKCEEQLAELTKQNRELESIRQSQANKIAELTEKMELQTNEDSDNRSRLEEECKCLMNELQSTRKSMEQLQRSEREVQRDFQFYVLFLLQFLENFIK